MKSAMDHMATRVAVSLSVLLSAALLLSGCGEPGAPSGSAPDDGSRALVEARDHDGLELADRVFWLVPERVAHLQIRHESLVFGEPIPADVRQLRAGDVLISDVGEGFWRAIERVEHLEDRLVLHTRAAALSEVVENGAFDFEVRSGQLYERERLVRRCYELAVDDQGICIRDDREPIDLEVEDLLDSLNLSADLGASSEADVANANLTVDATAGGIDFEPAIRLRLVLAGGQLVSEEFQVSGWADVDIDWTVATQGPTSLLEARSIPVLHRTLSFDVFGKTFHLNPDLRLLYEVTATGQGSVDLGFDGDGYVFAGYRCSLGNRCSALEPSDAHDMFDGIEVHQLNSGTPNISFRSALLAGVKLFEDGVDKARATPLKLLYETHANVSPPFCPYEASSSAEGTTLREGERFRSYFRDFLAVDQLFSGENGCGLTDDVVGEDESPCISDVDCPSGKMCLVGKNRCVEETPFSVTLKWTQPVDFDLRVETPSGEELSANTPVTSGGQLTHTSGGGSNCDGCIGECTGGVAVDCPNETPSGGTCPEPCDYRSNTLGQCEGGTYAASCLDLDINACIQVEDCFWDYEFQRHRCLGVYQASCSALGEQACSNSNNCTWNTTTADWCEGSTVDCSTLDQASCAQNATCSWEQGTGGGGELPPFIEHAALTPVSPGDKFRVWVVNASGSDDETVSYELLFRTDTGQNFEMRGEFEPAQSSQSVFFDYVYE